MDASHGDDPEVVVARAVGQELRRARQRIGWSRAELVSRLPSDIHVQTYATYERGVRQCTVGRFVEICRAMGVSASDLLNWALERTEIERRASGYRVDLQAILGDKRAELLPLRRWARKKIEDDHDLGGPGIVHLEWAVVQEMARLFDIDLAEFVNYLTMFRPRTN